MNDKAIMKGQQNGSDMHEAHKALASGSMFGKAVKAKSKLRLCVSGPSGSGKTWGALTLAESIKGNGSIAVVDTEHGSASLYADVFDFDVMEMPPPYHPSKFVDAIKDAENAGYSVIIIDSATHEWDGAGGCLEINEQTARSKFKGNTWSAWSDTTKMHQKFIDAIAHSKCHVIVTCRSKTETSQSENSGKKAIVRLGTKLVQRDNFEYEFTVALDLVHDGHFATPVKDRTSLFMDKDPQPITKETGLKLLAWLNEGASGSELLKTYIKDLKEAQDEAQLKERFFSAHKTLSKVDQSLLPKLTEAKDKCKSKLMESDNA